MTETSPCPICHAPVIRWERYPNLLCARCAGSARDARGCPMRFLNETLLGTGFVAEVREGEVWRQLVTPEESATCWVEGRRCLAREHRFGGIVVQTVDERSEPRSGST